MVASTFTIWFVVYIENPACICLANARGIILSFVPIDAANRAHVDGFLRGGFGGVGDFAGGLGGAARCHGKDVGAEGFAAAAADAGTFFDGGVGHSGSFLGKRGVGCDQAGVKVFIRKDGDTSVRKRLGGAAGARDEGAGKAAVVGAVRSAGRAAAF